MTLWKDKILNRVINDHDKDPDNFLRADKRRNIQKLAKSYWSEMIQNEEFKNNTLPKLNVETVGNPFIFELDNRISPLSVQHLYHLFIMKEKLNLDLMHSDLIVEIGGGFGNICRILYQLGFKGKYVIIDFPEQHRIQQGFLSKSGIDLTNISFLTLDLNQIENQIKNSNSSLLGTFSINEMPMEDREHIEQFYNDFDNIFIAHNFNFDGINNEKYFSNLNITLKDQFNTQYFKDSHMKAWFLIGKKL